VCLELSTKVLKCFIKDDRRSIAVEGSVGKGFIPQKGDIFVWRRSNVIGHTGVVLEANKDKITIMEAIGSVCSADETFNKNNGGDTQCGCTRKAVYKTDGPALYKHDGWKGYFRPITK